MNHFVVYGIVVISMGLKFKILLIKQTTETVYMCKYILSYTNDIAFDVNFNTD